MGDRAIAPDPRDQRGSAGRIEQAERLLEFVDADLVVITAGNRRLEDEGWVQRVGERIDEPRLGQWVEGGYPDRGAHSGCEEAWRDEGCGAGGSRELQEGPTRDRPQDVHRISPFRASPAVPVSIGMGVC